MHISLIVESFTFNNKNTTVSDDFLNGIKNNKYDTSVFFDYYDTMYVEECIKIKKPSIIVLVQVGANDRRLLERFKFISSLDIPIYFFIEDTYYYTSTLNTLPSATTGLILWYKNKRICESFASINKKLTITNFDSRFVNTNIYKDYKLEKKYDILLYGARNCIYTHTDHLITVQDYLNKNSHRYADGKIPFYPVRDKLESMLVNRLQSRYNVYIVPITDIYLGPTPAFANENLSKLINQSYLTVCCSSIADVLLHKHMEIPASNSVILGSYPSDYEDLFKGNIVEVNEFMDDETIVRIIDDALSDKRRLLDMSESLCKKIHQEHNLLKASENFSQIVDHMLSNRK
jgi:hypothetical protein